MMFRIKSRRNFYCSSQELENCFLKYPSVKAVPVDPTQILISISISIQTPILGAGRAPRIQSLRGPAFQEVIRKPIS
jgi:hypothetical protein